MIKEITKVIEAHGLHRTNLRSALDELAADLEKLVRDECMGFLQWAEDEQYYQHPTGPRWYIHGMSVGGKTTSELYQIYINSKNNSNDNQT